jgi:hypothetical protein
MMTRAWRLFTPFSPASLSGEVMHDAMVAIGRTSIGGSGKGRDCAVANL